MVVLQVPPTSLIHKMATKDHCRAIAIGNIYLKEQEGTGCMPWFFIMSTDTKIKCAIILWTHTYKKIVKILFFNGYISNVSHFHDLDNKCPKIAMKSGTSGSNDDTKRLRRQHNIHATCG